MKNLLPCESRLVLLLAATLVLASILVAVPLPAVRVVSGVLMVFLLPGYLLLGLLWPGSRLEGLWRLSLTVPASIALVGGLLLILSYFWTYTYERALALVTILNGLLALSGYARCRATGPDGALSVDWLSRGKHLLQDYRRRGGHALLTIACLAFLGSVAFAILTPRQVSTLTEFYVLTADGHLPLSPDELAGSGTVTYGIHNLEGRSIEYRLVVRAETPESSTEIWSQSVAVPIGATVESTVDLSSKPPGTQAIQLLLFLPDEPDPYRSLRLTLDSDQPSGRTQ